MGMAAPVKIIAVGDELLEGRTLDSNSRDIQRALGGHAVQVELVQMVPDRQDAIVQALDRTTEGDLVFMCGGLGSTPDDLTREAVAVWGGVDLPEDERAMEMIRARYRRRGRAMHPVVARQARVPAGLRPVANPVGSAPGLVGRLRGRHLILLPGFPAELNGLLPLMVAELRGSGLLPAEGRVLTYRLAQITELALVDLCRPVMDSHPGLKWSWWVTDWGVDLRVAAPGGCADDAMPQEMADALEAALGHHVFSRRDQDLAAVVQKMMLARAATCGVAESCTGGLIGGALTANPGSSGFFRGGFLVYADDAKSKLLEVGEADLAGHGAVSEPVARAMAAGCRRKLGCDYALAVSGISGPGGGTEGKPVGTTWVAVATPSALFAHCYRFPADRRRNRLLTVAAALDSLRRVLQFGDDADPWSLTAAWDFRA